MKKITFQGLEIVVENPAGSVRSGKDKLTGKKWSVTMPWDYGFFKKTEGVDGDEVDVFVGPNKHARFAYVIHQLDKNTGEFDEDKVFLGWDDSMDAKAAFFKCYDSVPEQFYGTVETIPMKTFKEKLLGTKADPTMIHASTKMNKTIALYADAVTHEVITKGSQVTVDGMHGRGIVTAVNGTRVNITFRNGITLSRDIMFVHNIADRTKKMWMDAGEENVEMEGQPEKSGKWIEKVGTQFCIRSNEVDKNLGCWPSKEKAEAVMAGKSFIETEMQAGKKKKMKAVTGTMPQTGWQYGKRTMPVGYVPARTLTGFPSGKGGGRGSLPKSPSGTGHKLPNPSGTSGMNVRRSNPGMKRLESYADLGEPMAGAMGHAHIDPNLFFHPPSLLKRNKETHVPTDDPGEKNDRFGDVTKRNQAHKDRMKILKRSSPGNTLIPARTTLLAPHQGSLGSGVLTASHHRRKRLNGGMYRAYNAAKI